MAETVKKAAGENVGIPAVGVVFKKPVGDSRIFCYHLGREDQG